MGRDIKKNLIDSYQVDGGFSGLVKTRRTIRKYKDEAVPDDKAAQILEDGRWAPSAHNLQPWKFIVIRERSIIKSVQKIMLKKQGELFTGFNIVMRETAKCLDTCPMLIAVYSDSSITKKFDRLEEPYTSVGSLYEIQSISFAIYGMMLSAHNIGLGTACLGIALFCEKEINALLRQGGVLMALLSVGFPTADEPMTKRKKISEISRFI